MRYDIFAAGFPFVEFERVERNLDFKSAGTLIGPFASADVCILLDVAAKMGLHCCFSGPVGDDIFGEMIKERMRNDGVNVNYMRVVEGSYTGLIFVRYDVNGTREYLEVINGSSYLSFCDLDVNVEAVENSRCVHFSGEVIEKCNSSAMLDAVNAILAAIPLTTLVSFDPNFTGNISAIRNRFAPFVERANVIMPSEQEAANLMGETDDSYACIRLANEGKLVALKQGRRGCCIYHPYNQKITHIPALNVDELDPTGSGDSFCAGFLYGLLNDWSPDKSGLFANAAGAIQATVMGPMEGIVSCDEVLNFINTYFSINFAEIGHELPVLEVT